MTIQEKFDCLGMTFIPHEEDPHSEVPSEIRGEMFWGGSVDFTHGDIDAHLPIPGSFELFSLGVEEGSIQAHTAYRGRDIILEDVAQKLSSFMGVSISPKRNLIITPGSQAALFLALGSNILPGDKVAIVEPDYFANRRMVEFLHGEVVSVPLHYMKSNSQAGLDFTALEHAFQSGVRVFLFSNPNNPVGCVYSQEEISKIASLAKIYDVTLIVDELYSRQIYQGVTYTHLCAQSNLPDNLITIIGPSKSESLSGYRLGVAIGNPEIIQRAEKLQTLISLRCGGYSQAVLRCWFSEPDGWMENRLSAHQAIRDALMKKIHQTPDVTARLTEGGSYLFVTLPQLDISLPEFIEIARVHAGVSVTAGTEFGPTFTQSFRINFSQNFENAITGFDRLMQLVEHYRTCEDSP